MRCHCPLFVLFVLTATVGTLEAAEPIIPKNATLEKLFEGITLTEGVAVAPDGMVYFSDITFSHQAVLETGAMFCDAGRCVNYRDGAVYYSDPRSGSYWCPRRRAACPARCSR